MSTGVAPTTYEPCPIGQSSLQVTLTEAIDPTALQHAAATRAAVPLRRISPRVVGAEVPQIAFWVLGGVAAAAELVVSR